MKKIIIILIFVATSAYAAGISNLFNDLKKPITPQPQPAPPKSPPKPPVKK